MDMEFFNCQTENQAETHQKQRKFKKIKIFQKITGNRLTNIIFKIFYISLILNRLK